MRNVKCLFSAIFGILFQRPQNYRSDCKLRTYVLHLLDSFISRDKFDVYGLRFPLLGHKSFNYCIHFLIRRRIVREAFEVVREKVGSFFIKPFPRRRCKHLLRLPVKQVLISDKALLRSPQVCCANLQFDVAAVGYRIVAADLLLHQSSADDVVLHDLLAHYSALSSEIKYLSRRGHAVG